MRGELAQATGGGAVNYEVPAADDHAAEQRLVHLWNQMDLAPEFALQGLLDVLELRLLERIGRDDGRLEPLLGLGAQALVERRDLGQQREAPVLDQQPDEVAGLGREQLA